ncbi:hypothetical protein A2690_01565 [Candidatus Roizmanbacteria bacterium RIFCSPHIGHO2_01_FULL_39_12b]|uniref:Uncharacterized protein n=1 Tax=Candidatus Roizmanbacteria bacterium RIFCSPHIGHO2_01_FULL_39_12b TaxID=1802030 RepID=A0A1F7G7S6_9BACT|nr:MAG: hypothetical protein A2690_01565 [Candidatus Roizmanbacteria bacterium RIFCSPHIGHO2_01_FULL_39_12b]
MKMNTLQIEKVKCKVQNYNLKLKIVSVWIVFNLLAGFLVPLTSRVSSESSLKRISRLTLPMTYHTSLVLTKNQEPRTKN